MSTHTKKKGKEKSCQALFLFLLFSFLRLPVFFFLSVFSFLRFHHIFPLLCTALIYLPTLLSLQFLDSGLYTALFFFFSKKRDILITSEDWREDSRSRTQFGSTTPPSFFFFCVFLFFFSVRTVSQALSSSLPNTRRKLHTWSYFNYLLIPFFFFKFHKFYYFFFFHPMKTVL